MSRLSRRLTLSVVLLGLTLALAAPPVQAADVRGAGWFEAVANQLARWAAGWSWLPHDTATAGTAPDRVHQGTRRPDKSPRPPVRTNCGTTSDPTGACS
jgi:hypothetical protein